MRTGFGEDGCGEEAWHGGGGGIGLGECEREVWWRGVGLGVVVVGKIAGLAEFVDEGGYC